MSRFPEQDQRKSGGGASLADADLTYRSVLAGSGLRASGLKGPLDFADKQLAAHYSKFSKMQERISGPACPRVIVSPQR